MRDLFYSFLEDHVELYFTDRELFLKELDIFLDSSYKKGLVGWDYFFIPKSGDIFTSDNNRIFGQSEYDDIHIIMNLDAYPNKLECGISELTAVWRDKKIKSILNEKF
jgi:hypothetical protein